MVRLLHVTIFEGDGVASHKETYACAELLDITGRPIKKERVKTSVRENKTPATNTKRERERERGYIHIYMEEKNKAHQQRECQRRETSVHLYGCGGHI